MVMSTMYSVLKSSCLTRSPGPFPWTSLKYLAWPVPSEKGICDHSCPEDCLTALPQAPARNPTQTTPTSPSRPHPSPLMAMPTPTSSSTHWFPFPAIYLSTRLSIYPSTCSPIYQPTSHLFTWPPTCLRIYPSTYHLSTCPPVHPTTHPCIHPSIHHPSILLFHFRPPGSYSIFVSNITE